jgi:hypothetical protein
MTPEEREFEVEHMIAARDQVIQDLASHDLCGTGGRLTVASPRSRRGSPSLKLKSAGGESAADACRGY